MTSFHSFIIHRDHLRTYQFDYLSSISSYLERQKWTDSMLQSWLYPGRKQSPCRRESTPRRRNCKPFRGLYSAPKWRSGGIQNRGSEVYVERNSSPRRRPAICMTRRGSSAPTAAWCWCARVSCCIISGATCRSCAGSWTWMRAGCSAWTCVGGCTRTSIPAFRTSTLRCPIGWPCRRWRWCHPSRSGPRRRCQSTARRRNPSTLAETGREEKGYFLQPEILKIKRFGSNHVY